MNLGWRFFVSLIILIVSLILFVEGGNSMFLVVTAVSAIFMVINATGKKENERQ